MSQQDSLVWLMCLTQSYSPSSILADVVVVILFCRKVIWSLSFGVQPLRRAGLYVLRMLTTLPFFVAASEIGRGVTVLEDGRWDQSSHLLAAKEVTHHVHGARHKVEETSPLCRLRRYQPRARLGPQ